MPSRPALFPTILGNSTTRDRRARCQAEIKVPMISSYNPACFDDHPSPWAQGKDILSHMWAEHKHVNDS